MTLCFDFFTYAYSHIIDDAWRMNAQRFEWIFYVLKKEDEVK